MGIFHKQREVVNRAPVDIAITFDGQQTTLPPGRSTVPEVVIPYGKNQNPVMGTQDPNNPHLGGAQYLLGAVGKWDGQEDNITPLTPEEWAAHLGQPQRINAQEAFEEKYGTDPKAKLVKLGAPVKSAARSRADAGEGPKGLATFESK